MYLQTYNQIFRYLQTLKHSPDTPYKDRRQHKTLATKYFIENNHLYWRTSNLLHHHHIILKSELPQILWLNHQHPLGGHFVIIATYEKLKISYYWDNMFEDVKLYVQQCDRCQQIGKRKINEWLYPIKTGQPFELVGIDIIRPLTPSLSGNRYIIIAINYLTKWAEARALQFADSTEVTAFIYKDIISHHGIPKSIITDHNALIGLFNTAQPTGMIAKWITFLSEFDFEPKFHPGHTNNNFDFLSRLGY